MASNGSINTNDFEGRYLLFSWSLASQDIENNSSIITWSLKGAGNATASYYESGSFKVVINGVTVYQSNTRIKLYNNTIVSSGSFTINHNVDGTKYFTAQVQGAIYYTSVNVSGSDGWTLPTINRYANIVTASDFNDSEDPSFTFTNPNNETLSISLGSIASPSLIVRQESAPSSPYIFTLTESERNDLRALATANTLEVVYTVKTLVGGEVVYTSTANAIMTIEEANPVIGGSSYEDINTTTKAITGDNQDIIQGYSLLQFTFTNLRALKGATLSKISVSVNSVVVESTLSGSLVASKVVTFGVVDSSNDQAAKITLIDSRGNKATKDINISMVPYKSPTAIIDCYREDNYKASTYLKVRSDYSSLNGNNSLTLTYQTKEDGGSYSSETVIADDTSYTILLSIAKAWTVKVNVSDLLSSTSYTVSIGEGTPLIFFDRLKKSIGFKCFPKYTESLEAYGEDLANYRPSESLTLNGVITSGYINSTDSLLFSVPVRKSLSKISVSFSSLSLTIRDPQGTVTTYSEVVGVSGFTVSVSKSSDNILTISVEKSGGYPYNSDIPLILDLSAAIDFA
jgi:hypothetical protein